MFYKTLRIIKQLIYIYVYFHKHLYSFFSLKVIPLPTAIKTCWSYSMVYLTKWCLFNFWIDLYSDSPKYLFPCPLLTTYPSFFPVPFFLIPTNTPLLSYSQPHNPLFPQAPSPHSCSAPLCSGHTSSANATCFLPPCLNSCSSYPSTSHLSFLFPHHSPTIWNVDPVAGVSWYCECLPS